MYYTMGVVRTGMYLKHLFSLQFYRYFFSFIYHLLGEFFPLLTFLKDDIYNWAELLNRFDDFFASLSNFYEKRTVLDLPIPTRLDPTLMINFGLHTILILTLASSQNNWYSKFYGFPC